MSRNGRDPYAISRRRLLAGAGSSIGLAAFGGRAVAETSREIRVGNICAYSGPASMRCAANYQTPTSTW